MEAPMRFLRVLLILGALGIIIIVSSIRWLAGNPAPQDNPENDGVKMNKSDVIVGFEWMGAQIPYPPPAPGTDATLLGPISNYFAKAGYQVHGDTFPMTWADDNEIYASAGDPNWGGKDDGLDVEMFSGMPPHYTITRVNPMSDYRGSGGDGQKPSGMICVNGVLYLAFQSLLKGKPPAYGAKSQHGDDAAIVSSQDHGKTWMPDIKSMKGPMFPGNHFGGPAFINFGRNNAHARDNYVYAISNDQWDNGSLVRLGRVPSNRIQDAGAWEWVAELKPGSAPRWSKNLNDAIPIFSDERRVSLPDMVYIAPIKRYLMLTWRLYKDFSPDDGTELFIYDAPEPWGPFTLVHHEKVWESIEMNPYCPRLPLKWLHATPDGVEGWLQFSGSWRPNSGEYRSHVRQFRLQVRTPKMHD
jgi:hypothetical protein